MHCDKNEEEVQSNFNLELSRHITSKLASTMHDEIEILT